MTTKAEDSFFIDMEFKKDFKQAPNGDFALISGLENLKQRLFTRLITVPGTLAHRPLFGVGVQLWQNNIGSIDKQRSLAIAIKKQFEQDAGVESVDSVSIHASNTVSGQFTISYKVTPRGAGQIVNTVNPFGELTI